jgi:hypothetical protein
MKAWQPIASAPFDREIQVSVIEKGEVPALVGPCRRRQNGWYVPQPATNYLLTRPIGGSRLRTDLGLFSQ